MAKTKISEFSATPSNNTDIDGINISEGCAPSGINDAIRELMAQLKDWQAGTSNDPYVIGSSGSLTLNQGTANGVLYLNGSKVVTSGTALVFDGTNLGVGVSATKLIEAKSTTTNLARIRVNGTGTTAGNYRGYELSNGSTFKGGLLQDESTDAISVFTPVGGISYTLNNDGTSIWAVGGSEQMRLTSTGLGIGTSSPAAKLNVNGTALFNGTTKVTSEAVEVQGNLVLGNYASYSTSNFREIIYSASTASFGNQPVANIKFQTTSDIGAAITFLTRSSAGDYAERARIDSSGNLLIGTTSVANSSKQTIGFTGSTTNGLSINDTQGTNASIGYANFSRSGTSIGSITYASGTGLTSYNSTSDYRAKDIIGAVTNSGALIDSVPVYMGKMKGATQERPMFIAHETPEYAHTGEKDAVDEDGNPVYQQMDASALIPVMWAEIQSLRVRVAQLESN